MKVFWIFCLLQLFLNLGLQAQDFDSQLAKLPEKERLVFLNNYLEKCQNFTEIPYQKYARYALSLARKTGFKLEEARALILLGYGYYREMNFEKALESYFQARQIAENINDWQQIARTNKEISNIFNYCYSDYPKALFYYQQVLALTRKRGKPLDLISPLNNIGNIYSLMGEYTKVPAYLLQALEIAEKNDSTNKVPILLLNLSEIYQLLGDDQKFLETIEKARFILAKTNYQKNQGLARINSLLGEWQQKKGNYAQALVFFEKSLVWQKESQDLNNIPLELHNLGWTYFLSGNKEKAQQYLFEALALRRSIQNQPGIAETTLALGKINQASGNFKAAQILFNESLRICKNKNLKKMTVEVYGALSELALEMNKPALALRFTQLADTLKKNLLGPQVTGPIMNLLMTYEKEKYGQEIKERQKLFIVFSLILIMLLVIMLLVYRRQRQKAVSKNKSYEQLLAEQRLLLKNMQAKLREMAEKEEPKKYEKSKLSLEKAHDCLRQLITIMTTEKKYLDPELSLKSLSETLEVNTTYLSQIINEHLGKNLTDYVNQFRVEEAKRILCDPKQKKLSLTDVAFQAGFNSIPSFNRVFKKLTGLSPSHFSHDSSGRKAKGKKQAKGKSLV